MPKVVMLTTAADADGVRHVEKVYTVSKKEAEDLIAAGAARALGASESAVSGASENASGRRGRSNAVSGPDEDA
jgi:hypothetical protein